MVSMAESILKEIVDQVVQITDVTLKDKIAVDRNADLETEELSVDHAKTSASDNVKEVFREAIEDRIEVKCVPTEIDKITEVDSESDPNDDIFTDENNNDLLTTEDEAEDFLRHVLRESENGGNLRVGESEGFDISVEGIKPVVEIFTEKCLNTAYVLANVIDSTATTTSENLLGQTNGNKFGVDRNKDSESSLEQKTNNLFCNASTVNVKGSVNSVNKDSDTKATGSPDPSLLLTVSSHADDIKTNADNSNNNSSCSSMLDDQSLFKYDWSNCYNSYVTDNRDMCTPDAEVESISPELCCIMQLSPDAIYGKDHTIGSQRLYSRQVPHTVRPGSTLNTPDPICFGDTDSNELDMPLLRKYDAAGSENPLPSWSEMDINNKIGPSDASKGTKRKRDDSDNQKAVTPSPGILSNEVVTNLMNQGRPPDISTWRTVSPSSDSQSSGISDDIGGQWNKPTCTVPPFQNTGNLSNTSTSGLYGTNQHQGMHTARVYNPYESPSDSSVTQQAYNQYNMSERMPRSSCQFTANQTGNFANYGCEMYNNGLQNSAAYRIDFTSPVNVGAPGMLNFVSHPSYLGAGLTRPQAVYANNMPNMNLNTACSNGPSYSNMPNRHCFNTGQFINFHQPQSQVPHTLPLQNPYMNHLNNNSHTPRNPPSATQTFAESQTDNVSKFENIQKNSVAWKAEEKLNELQVSNATDSNKKTKVLNAESTDAQNVKTNAVGCEECDLVCSNTDSESHENTQDSIKTDDTVSTVEKSSHDASLDDQFTSNQDETVTSVQDKGIQSNEADSTTIDLTGDSVEEDKGNEETRLEVSDDAASPTPAHAYPQVQNKYFTEIYMQKCRSNSPITSFCTALDLSKKVEKKESKRPSRPTVPPKIRPYGEPSIPVSTFLNSVQAPTLAYSGAMLVPYMNSIFAAMANINKTQTSPLYSQVGTFANTYGNTSQAKTTQNTRSVSPLTHTGNLTLNQQVLMYSNFLSLGATSACSKNASHSQSTSTVASTAVTGPTMNVNSIPLPLYATPLQYPIRPLVSVMNPAANVQGLQNVNPYLYRLNIGLPLQTAGNVPFSSPAATDNNNNTVTSTASGSILCSNASTSNRSKTTNTATKAKKTRAEITQNRKKSPAGGQGGANLKQPMNLSGSSDDTSLPACRSISAVDGLTMSIQGGNFTAAQHTQSKALTTYQPVPDGRLYRSFSDHKRRTFKAKHFPFSYLQIGTFEYRCGVSNNDKAARVKFLFSKKVMVYEFQLENPDGSAGVCKDMVEIEVPFCSIVSLWLYDKDMRVEVKEAPKSCLGKKGPERNMKYKFCNAAVYDRKLRMDITNGQLSSTPYHYVQFRNCCADRLKAELREFDNRFEIMLRLPLIEDPSKSLKQGAKQLSSQLLDPSICLPEEEDVNNNLGPVYRPDLNEEVSVLVSCCCTNGCSAESCQCCVKGTTCSEGMCDCVNCRNPLNILHQLGLPADRARTDPCLMENIYQIKRLDCYVKTQLVLECCNIPVLLFCCIPGEVRCVGLNCNARYKYSWCTARLLNEESTPRNHCVTCGRCTDYRNSHCQRCNICYFAGEDHTDKCPVCLNSGRGNPGNNSSTDSEA